MLGNFILGVLTLVLVVLYRRILFGNIFKIENSLKGLQEQHHKLLQENTLLMRENFDFKASLGKTIALYDITKVICKSLDEERVFSLFKEEIGKYMQVDDCKFLQKDDDLSQYVNYIVIPLEIEKNSIGYLVASGVARSEKEKFNILAQQFVLGIKRAILYQRVQELAIVDSLTDVFSRRYWMERFSQEIERSKKYKFNFSFLMVDIDHFKSFNDKYGHLVGDAVLKEVAKRIKQNLRQIDLIGRYGGEEFCVILIETDKAGAQFAAERIRQAVEAQGIRVYDEDLKITVSIGISVFPEDSADKDALIDKADSAMYRAKQNGRNRVYTHDIK